MSPKSKLMVLMWYIAHFEASWPVSSPGHVDGLDRVSGHVEGHLGGVLLHNVLLGQQLVDRWWTGAQRHCDWSNQIQSDLEETMECVTFVILQTEKCCTLEL